MRLEFKDFKGRCPNCGSSSFKRGPRGGLAYMLRCSECCQELTVYPFFGVEVW